MAQRPRFICPRISVLTEMTVKIAWPQLLLAILLGPAFANAIGMVLCLLFPPALLFAYLFGVASLFFGYLSYLILAGPLMILAQALGGDHPLIHAAIGFGAVQLIPAADAIGLPILVGPEMVEMGQWFGPVWCAVAAGTYNFLRREFAPDEEA